MDIKDIATLHEKYNTHEFIKMRGQKIICKECGRVSSFYEYDYLTKKTKKELGLDKTQYYNLIYNNQYNEPYIKYYCIMENNIKIENISKEILDKMPKYSKNMIYMRNGINKKEENTSDSFILTIVSAEEYYIEYDILIKFIKDNIHLLKDYTVMYASILNTIIKYDQKQRKELVDLLIGNRKLTGEISLNSNNKKDVLDTLNLININKIKF